MTRRSAAAMAALAFGCLLLPVSGRIDHARAAEGASTEEESRRAASVRGLYSPDGTRPLGLDALAEKIRRNPGIAFLHNEYGNMLLQAARLKEALAQYETAAALEPRSPWLWNNVGVANQALHRYGRAKKAYRRAIALAPNYALAHYNLGVVYDMQGKDARAIDQYQRAIDLDPELLDIRKNPQIVANRHLAAILAKSYIERGGTVLFPIESSIPEPERRKRPR